MEILCVLYVSFVRNTTYMYAACTFLPLYESFQRESRSLRVSASQDIIDLTVLDGCDYSVPYLLCVLCMYTVYRAYASQFVSNTAAIGQIDDR